MMRRSHMFGRRRRNWSEAWGFLFEGLAVLVVLVSSVFIGNLLAMDAKGKIAHHCARELQRALQ
jgi:hypothetical protein